MDEEYIQNYIDDHFMGLALEEAKEAGYSHDEVPIGAIVVIPSSNNNSSRSIPPPTTTGPHHEDTLSHPEEKFSTTRHFKILSKGQNQIETQYDASAHAEMQALRMASRTIQNWRLLNATLYTTLEPCPMCLSAAQAFRVSRIVYGAPDLRLGAVETYMKLLDYPHPFHGSDAMEVVGGVKCEEARMLLVDFFRQRRRRNKE
jgi:Cytosine/adenosine deaminases